MTPSDTVDIEKQFGDTEYSIFIVDFSKTHDQHNMPQVIQMEICPWLFNTFDRFFESWLDCHIWVGQ